LAHIKQKCVKWSLYSEDFPENGGEEESGKIRAKKVSRVRVIIFFLNAIRRKRKKCPNPLD